MKLESRLRHLIRTVPDWPTPGIQFRDLTPVFQDAACWRDVVAFFVDRYRGTEIDAVAGIEARGFLLGSVLAHELRVAFVPIRKAGKLPFRTIARDYALEYGSATLEMHADGCRPGDRVVLVDDLIATAARCWPLSICWNNSAHWSSRRQRSSTCRNSVARRDAAIAGCRCAR